MRFLLRFFLACVLGSLFGVIVRKVTTSKPVQSAPAPVAPAEVGKATPASLFKPGSDDTLLRKRDKEEGVPAPLEPLYADTRPATPLTVTGYLVRGRKINVQLSDGRVLTERDPELQAEGFRLERNALHFADGRRLFLLGRPRESVSMEGVIESIPSPEPSQGDTVSAYPPPPAESSSSWQMHSDGVLRLTPSAQAAMRARGLSQ